MKIDFSSMSKEEMRGYLKALGIDYDDPDEEPEEEGGKHAPTA